MGITQTKCLDANDVESLKIDFNLTEDQIKHAYEIFVTLDRRDCGSLSKTDFMYIPELHFYPAGPSLITGLFSFISEDFNMVPQTEMLFPQFLRVYSIFGPDTIDVTTEEGFERASHRRIGHIRFIFRLLDSEAKGYIERNEVARLFLEAAESLDACHFKPDVDASAVKPTINYRDYIELLEQIDEMFASTDRVSYDTFLDCSLKLKLDDIFDDIFKSKKLLD